MAIDPFTARSAIRRSSFENSGSSAMQSVRTWASASLAKAASNSLSARASTKIVRRPSNDAASRRSRVSCSALGLAGFPSTPTVSACGTNSCRSSSRLALKVCEYIVKPVRLPPGRARLVASPSFTGSEAPT